MTALEKTTQGRRWGGRSEKDRLIEGEQIIRDRSMGMSISALCEKYGYTHETIASRIDKALAARLATSVDSYRAQQNDILDNLMERQAQTLRMADAMLALGAAEQDVSKMKQAIAINDQATAQIVRLMERRAKLNGIDAPQEHNVTVTEVTQADLALADMIRETRARAASTDAATA